MVGRMPGKHCATEDATVVSVGPYALKKLRDGAQRSTTAIERASPPAMAVFRSGRSASGRCAQTEGASVTVVIRRSFMSRSSGSPGAISLRRARCRVAPVRSDSNTSRTDTSKLNEANCRTCEPKPIENRCRRHSIKLTTDLCSIRTPFGLPVDPEV